MINKTSIKIPITNKNHQEWDLYQEEKMLDLGEGIHYKIISHKIVYWHQYIKNKWNWKIYNVLSNLLKAEYKMNKIY